MNDRIKDTFTQMLVPYLFYGSIEYSDESLLISLNQRVSGVKLSAFSKGVS
jgi:hypothetical protein